MNLRPRPFDSDQAVPQNFPPTGMFPPDYRLWLVLHQIELDLNKMKYGTRNNIKSLKVIDKLRYEPF
jgi:hypothetical protein